MKEDLSLLLDFAIKTDTTHIFPTLLITRNTQLPIPNIQYPISDTQHPTPNAQHPAAIAHAMDILQKRLEQAKAEKLLLQQQNQLQSEVIKEQAPKVEYYDDVLSGKVKLSSYIAELDE